MLSLRNVILIDHPIFGTFHRLFLGMYVKPPTDAARAELLINITKLAPHQARMSYGMPRTRCFLTPWTRPNFLPVKSSHPSVLNFVRRRMID